MTQAWTPERRAAQSARMKEMFKTGTITTLGTPTVLQQWEVDAIHELVEERNKLRAELAIIEQKREDILYRIKSLSNDALAEKLEVSASTIKAALSGTYRARKGS